MLPPGLCPCFILEDCGRSLQNQPNFDLTKNNATMLILRFMTLHGLTLYAEKRSAVFFNILDSELCRRSIRRGYRR